MAVKNGKASSNAENNTQLEEDATTLGGKRCPKNERRNAIGKFSEPTYNKPISRAPIAQIINSQDPTKVGLFIKENILSVINWKGEAPTHTHLFGGTTEERGVLLQSPRLNIIQVSQRFIELREDEETGIKAGTLLNMVFESNEGYEFYMANKDKYVLRRFYFVFVLDEHNENVHEVPIAISLKGVASTKVGMAIDEFRTSLETAFANYNGTSKGSKTDEFHRLGVFNPTFVPSHEPKTETNPKKRSWVAIVDEYKSPVPDGSDFLDFFCEWKEQQYNELIATNPDLVMSISKASLIVQEHNRLVLKGSNTVGLLTPANTIDVHASELNYPPY